MTLDLTRPYACRNGSQAGATRGPNGWLYGWYKMNGCIISTTWNADGSDSTMPSSFDLINTPQHRTLDVWVNVYKDSDGHLPDQVGRPTRSLNEAARDAAMQDGHGWTRIACLNIVRDFTEGDGLT